METFKVKRCFATFESIQPFPGRPSDTAGPSPVREERVSPPGTPS